MQKVKLSTKFIQEYAKDTFELFETWRYNIYGLGYKKGTLE